MKANGKPPRLRQLRLRREILFMTQPRLLAVMLERYPQVVRWTRASRTTCGKGEVPSLKELEGLRMGLHKGVTHLPRTHLEIVEAAFLVTGFKFSKHGLVIRLSGSDELEKDAG